MDKFQPGRRDRFDMAFFSRQGNSFVSRKNRKSTPACGAELFAYICKNIFVARLRACRPTNNKRSEGKIKEAIGNRGVVVAEACSVAKETVPKSGKSENGYMPVSPGTQVGKSGYPADKEGSEAPALI